MLLNPSTRKKLLKQLLLLGISFPVTGFIYGFIAAEAGDSGLSVEIQFRSFIGLMYAVLNTITFGHPWLDEAGTRTTNITHYVLAAYLFLNLVIYVWQKSRKTKQRIQ